jgi:DNA polymerase III alpha subunit
MLCIQTHSAFADEKRMRMDGEEFYFKSPDEMHQVFGTEIPEALKNTLEVAEKCDFSFDTKQNHYPVYQVPEGHTQKERLREVCVDGSSAATATTSTIRTRRSMPRRPSPSSTAWNTSSRSSTAPSTTATSS